MKCQLSQMKMFLCLYLQLGTFLCKKPSLLPVHSIYQKGVCDNQNTSRESKHAFFRCHFQLSAHCFDVFSSTAAIGRFSLCPKLIKEDEEEKIQAAAAFFVLHFS